MIFMVVRARSKSRKFLGTRTWGAGNKKNRRGSGSRGGIGRAGKKHKFSRIVKYEPERIRKKGFKPWKQARLSEISVGELAMQAKSSNSKELMLRGYKVLSSGSIDMAVTVKASGFSKKASEKIKQAGGEAVKL